MFLTKDNIRLGLLLGFIAPLLAMLLYYFVRFYPLYTIGDYFALFIDPTKRPLLTAISTFSLFANVILFTIYINTHRDMTAKGIFIITCVFGLAAILIKVLLK